MWGTDLSEQEAPMAASNPFFEFPPEFQKIAEKNAEQMHEAFGQFVGAAREAVRHVEGHMETAMTGARDVREAALRMAEQNVANSFQFAQALLAARDAQDVVQIHSRFVKSQMTALTEQAQDLAQRASKMAEPPAKNSPKDGSKGGKTA
jgi:phasin